MLPKFIAVAVLVMLAAGSISANLTVPAEFRDVVARSGRIVRGSVTDVRSVAVPGRGIDSVVTVAIDTTLKGEGEPFVSFRVPGGTIGTRRFVMVGAPTFRVGQSAVWFLKRDPDEQWRPVGLSLGVYRVGRARSGQLMVAPPVMAGWTTAASGPVVRGDVRRQLLPVQEFESVVRLVMAGQALPARPTRPIDRHKGGR
jgi:hypothetical protein